MFRGLATEVIFLMFLTCALIVVNLIFHAVPSQSVATRQRIKEMSDKLAYFLVGIIAFTSPLWLGISLALFIAGQDIIYWVFAKIFGYFRSGSNTTSKIRDDSCSLH
jgi:hypothetical protein